MHKRILIVEDEPSIRDMVALILRKSGMEVIQTADANAAQITLSEHPPDLILLDWMLPGMSGLELARRLRREDSTRDIPIIMLTARGEEMDRVNALETCIDDYVVKPFSAAELIARIKAMLRRCQNEDESGSMELGGIRIDVPAQRVFVDQELVPLGPTEYRLLHFFMSHPERVYSRAQLLDQIWSNNLDVEERTVDVHIRRLRKKLRPRNLDNLIQTVHGTGYRFSTII